MMNSSSFEWDERKNKFNQEKHNVSFKIAQLAFTDPDRIIAIDMGHSIIEERYFCFGRVDEEIITVRFTYRKGIIRIIGAGYWREGKRIYEKENKIY
jgi:uncharacterized DUF497 family protein